MRTIQEKSSRRLGLDFGSREERVVRLFLPGAILGEIAILVVDVDRDLRSLHVGREVKVVDVPLEKLVPDGLGLTSGQVAVPSVRTQVVTGPHIRLQNGRKDLLRHPLR